MQLKDQDIDQLNSFLRGEIAATETYAHAIEKTDHLGALAVLRECHENHQDRVNVLRAEIRAAGGEPAEGSGAWGTFAKAVEGGAALFGDSAAVAALEEGEDHGLRDYRGDLEDLSPPARDLVIKRLLTEQQKTHDAMSRLKKIV